MRPDEHKKKKNAQYKKKHGIQTDKSKGGKPEDENKRGSKGEKTGALSSHSHRPSNEAGRPPARPLHSSSESEEDDEQSVGVEYERKSFRRRQITSNWARYDLPTAEEEEAQAAASRGENFEKLLSKAGGAHSHLKLRDEQDWGVGAGEREAKPPCLTLDLGDLGDCLQCLPLYQRLGLSKSLFSEEQLQQMEEEAAAKASSYTKTTRHSASSMTVLEASRDAADSTESDASSKTSSTSVASLKQRDLSLTNILKQQNSGVDSGRGASPKTDSVKVTEGKGAMTFTKPGVQASSSRSSAASAPSEESLRSNGAAESLVANADGASMISAELEDELDELLALDAPAAKPKSQALQPGKGVNQGAQSPGASSQQSPGQVETPQAGPGSASKMGTSGAGEEKLEDWLDSMLDG